MSTAPHLTKALLVIAAASLIGCENEEAAKPEPAKTTPVAAAAAPPKPTPAPPPPPEPHPDCPENSTGVGSFDKPCEAKGAERLMEVTWTGKLTDTGPSFRVINKSKLTILYGKIVTYFYDKAGKQLEVPAGASDTKPRQHQDCGGNIFSGVMKPGEKAVITFSCVNKAHVPEGTEAVEAEMKVVGFADGEGKKNEFYWQNDELAPDARPKGGIKDASKKTASKKAAK